MPVADVPEPWEIFWRRHHHSTRRGDWFCNDGCHCARVFIEDEILDGVYTVDLTGGVGLAIVTTVAVGGGDGERPRHQRTIVGVNTLRCAADTHGAIRRSMVRAATGNDFIAFGFSA